MNKYLSSIYLKLSLFIILLWGGRQFTYAFSGGDGSKDNPYLISTLNDLNSIPNESTSYYCLVNDIEGATPRFIVFKGHFDGNNHYISINYKYTKEDGSSGLDPFDYGLFSTAIDAEFINLTIKGIMSVSSISDTNYEEEWWKQGGFHAFDLRFVHINLGAICGSATTSTFSDCNNLSSISAVRHEYIYNAYFTYRDSNVGGIVGKALGCAFSRCSNSGNISETFFKCEVSEVENKAYNYGGNTVGGIVGYMQDSEIINSYNSGNIHANSANEYYIAAYGGICGKMEASNIKCCYSVGTMTCNNSSMIVCEASGGSVSQCFTVPFFTKRIEYFSRIVRKGTCSITSCYSTNTAIGENHNYLSSDDPTSKNGCNVDDEYIFMPSWYSLTMPDWDFSDVWYLSNSSQLPIFKVTPDINISNTTVTYGENVSLRSSNPYKNIIVVVDDETAFSIEDKTLVPLKSGIFKITISQEAFDVYKKVTKDFTLHVNKAPLKAKVSDITMIYGDNVPQLLFTYEGFLMEDNEDDIISAPTIQCDANSQSVVGEYYIKLSGGTSDKYEITCESGKLTVNPRMLYAKPVDEERIYGTSNPTFHLDYSGFVNGDNISLITKSPTVVTEATNTSSVGEYWLTCSGGEVYKNYQFSYQTGILTIKKANLRIKVKDAERFEGEDNPDFELEYSGFKNNEDYTALDELPIAVCSATKSSPAGKYPITIQGGYDRNYNYIVTEGYLTVKAGTSGIGNVKVGNSSIKEIYKSNGIRTYSICKGLNIVKTNDGKTIKIIAK